MVKKSGLNLVSVLGFKAECDHWCMGESPIIKYLQLCDIG